MPSTQEAKDWGDKQLGPDDDVALLQIKLSKSSSQHVAAREKLRSTPTEPFCVDMKNQFSYFSVEVDVGSTKQAFDLVADTGSNYVIIPDCLCVTRGGGCLPQDACFNSGSSSSFVLTAKNGLIPVLFLSFGSGDIQCFLSSDGVSVGAAQAYMENGVFLMENRRALHISGSFEGIIGMGLPGIETNLRGEKTFFPNAGVSRYSLCFNDVGSLRMNVPALVNPMEQIGTVHWGLDLQGMSVGNASAPVSFCDPSTKKPGMETACGAIPDSGTTYMMGPPDQINALFAGICSAWPRCAAIAQDDREIIKAQIFVELLYNCSDWLTADEGIYEVPSIFLHLAGADGVPQKVELTAWDFIVETILPVIEIVTKSIFGVTFVLPLRTGEFEMVCTPMFGASGMATLLNGPVWIIGSPLFWGNTVSFDISSDRKQIAISQDPCTSCKTSLLATSEAKQRSRVASHRLRRVTSLRESSVNRTRGL